MAELQDIRQTRGVRPVEERMQALASYMGLPEDQRDSRELARFLTEEVLEADVESWSRHCAQVLNELARKYGWKGPEFLDVSALIFEMMGDRSLKARKLCLELLSPWIPPGDPQVLEWLESQLHGEDPAWRSYCRKKLAELDIQNADSRLAPEFENREIDLGDWNGWDAKTRLKWLGSTTLASPCQDFLKKSGLKALIQEEDRFVLSRLARILPKVLHQKEGPLPYMWGGFLQHPDARIRSNALEGLFFWVDSQTWQNTVFEIAEQSLKDADARVRTAALKLLHTRDPGYCFEILGGMLRSCKDEEELESLIWLMKALDVLELWGADLERTRESIRKEKS